MSRPRGRRELTTIQAVKQLITGQSQLPDWTREVSAKVNSYQSGRLCIGGRVTRANLSGSPLCHCEERSDEAIPVGSKTRLPRPDKSGLAMTKRAWCWMKEAATKIWGRDLQEPVSSLVLVMVGADEQDDYLCPWSILRKEGDGRSWAINNTSNISGVE